MTPPPETNVPGIVAAPAGETVTPPPETSESQTESGSTSPQDVDGKTVKSGGSENSSKKRSGGTGDTQGDEQAEGDETGASETDPEKEDAIRFSKDIENPTTTDTVNVDPY